MDLYLGLDNPDNPAPDSQKPSLYSDCSQALPTFPPIIPLGSHTTENPAITAETNMKNRRTRNALPLYSPNSGSVEALGYSLTPLTV